MDSVRLIEELCALDAPSGFEACVADYIWEKISPLCPDARRDRMGNIIVPVYLGDREAKGRSKIMVSAHMDEVGFMINEIRADGYLGFDTIGGISESVMAGRRVHVLTENGTLDGVIASKAIHHKDKEERTKPPKLSSLYIDIGASDGDEAKKYVRIGDAVTFASEFYTFGEGFVKGKALDDRMGCAAMIEIISELAEDSAEGNADVYFCFTVREEIGLSGARVAAFDIRPDVAVVLETTAVADIADTVPSKRVATLGEGVAVSVMDRSTVYDAGLVRSCLDTASKNGIKAQVKRYVSGGNDAGSIHKTAEGVRTLALSVPTRYLHSPACVARLCDYEEMKTLCKKMICET